MILSLSPPPPPLSLSLSLAQLLVLLSARGGKSDLFSSMVKPEFDVFGGVLCYVSCLTLLCLIGCICVR
jgi:hypothetical protein